MAVQTIYGLTHGKYYKGMVADLQLLNTVSKLNKTASNIEYGFGVFSDGDNGMKLGTTGAVEKNFIGVAMRELNRAYQDDETFGAPVNADATVVTKGIVVVKALTSVVKDDAVFVRVGATGQGDFANAAGTGATESIEITGAKFLETVAAGELVTISLGLGG